MDRAGGRGCCARCREWRHCAFSAYLNMRGRSVQQRGRGCVPQVFVVPPAWGQGLHGDSESAGAEPRCHCPPYPSGWAGRFPFPHLAFLISEMVMRRQWYGALGTAVSAVFSRASFLLITRRGEWRVTSEWRLVNPDSPSRAAAAKGKGETKGQLHPEGRTMVLRTRLKAGPWPFPVQPVLCLALT